MFPCRKILELHIAGVSMRGIVTIKQDTWQKFLETIKLEEKNKTEGVEISEELLDDLDEVNGDYLPVLK